MYSVCLGVLCSPPQSAVQIKYLFSSAWLSFLQEFTTQEKKLISSYIWIRWSKNVIYLFCCQGHLKHFLENNVFCRKSGNDTCSRRWAREGSCCLCHYDALPTKIDMWLTPYILTFLKLLKKWSRTIMIKTVSQLISP